MNYRLNRRNLLKNTLVIAGGGAIFAAGVQQKAGASESRTTAATSPSFVVDVHVHMSQPPVYTAFRDVLFKPFKAQYDGEGNRQVNPKKYSYLPEQIIDRMDEAGVDISFVMIAENTRNARGRPGSYEYMAKQIQKYPGRLIGVPMYDPLYEPSRNVEFVDYVADTGFKSIKLSSPYQEYSPYDEKIWPLYERAVKRDISVTFHTGWAPLASAPIHWANIEIEALDNVGIRFPELKVHLAHAGGPHMWNEAVLVTAKHENFSLDFSSWGVYPPQQLIAMLALARDIGGIEKVMFGTEHSVCDPAMMVAQIRNINLWAKRLYYAPFSDEDIRKILGLNAAAKWNLEIPLKSKGRVS